MTLLKFARLLSALFVLMLAGCEKVFGSEDSPAPRPVDLRVAFVGTEIASLEWSIPDGTKPGDAYLVAVGNPAPSWPADPSLFVTVPATGTTGTMEYVAEGLARATTYEAYLVSARVVDTGVIYSAPTPIVNFTTEAQTPGDVADFEATLVSPSSASFAWTEVDDGAGRPAAYLLAQGTPSVDLLANIDGATRIPGTAVGARKSFTVTGLSPSTAYQFQIAAVRSDTVLGAPSAPVNVSTPAQPVVLVEPFFVDDFDNGTKTNANGVSWKPVNTRVTVSTERPFSGTHSLRFRFGPDSVGKDSNAEQRFDLGRYLTGYWVEYMLYVPANFTHRNESPNNNKFFMTWRDNYETADGTWHIGMEYQSDAAISPWSRVRPMSTRWDMQSWTSSGLGHPQHNAPFIGGTGPIKVGQWNRIRLHFAAASSRTAADGVHQMWVNDSLTMEMTNGKFHNFFATPVDAVLRNGYFLGYANSGFAEETIFYIDAVKFYDQDPGWRTSP